MNMPRRHVVGLMLLAMLTLTAASRAQVLKQVPADPWVIVKFNNLESINAKIGAFSQKLGLANFDPAFADPLSALKKQFNIKEGLDAKGEMAIAVYPPTPGESEPRAVALLPVSDYKAFLANLNNVKSEGELTTFSMPDDDDPIYAANWGAYAAVTPNKDLLANKPAGVEVPGFAGQQLAKNDATFFVNMKALGPVLLPQFQAHREQMLKQLDTELANNQGFNQKFRPVVNTIVTQVLDFAQNVLQEGQGATLGLNLNDPGLNITFAGEFNDSGSLAQTIKGIKNTDAPLVGGLPARKYFAFGGGVSDPATATKIFDQAVGPIRKELEQVPEAKTIITMLDAARTSFSAINSAAFGYAVPTAPPGEQSIQQQVAIYQGDANKLAEAQRQMMQGMGELMGLLTGAGDLGKGSAAVDFKPGAKSVAGVNLDQFTMQIKIDPNTPQGAQANQMMAMLYGPGGISGVMGAVNPQTYVAVVGGPDDLVEAAVASAKDPAQTPVLTPSVKGVADQLPKNRAMVYYIDLGNIITEVAKFAAQQGVPINIKLPEDLPPIGVAAGTEGSAFRVDSHLSTELISQLFSAGFQAFMGMQRGAAPPPQPPQPNQQ